MWLLPWWRGVTCRSLMRFWWHIQSDIENCEGWLSPGGPSSGGRALTAKVRGPQFNPRWLPVFHSRQWHPIFSWGTLTRVTLSQCYFMHLLPCRLVPKLIKWGALCGDWPNLWAGTKWPMSCIYSSVASLVCLQRCLQFYYLSLIPTILHTCTSVSFFCVHVYNTYARTHALCTIIMYSIFIHCTLCTYVFSFLISLLYFLYCIFALVFIY